jgi:hypothetical protein
VRVERVLAEQQVERLGVFGGAAAQSCGDERR